MKLVKILVASLAAAVLVSSCGVVNRSSSYQAAGSQLIIPIDQLVYLGDSEISVDYETNLVFTHITAINGQDYDPAVKNYGDLGGRFSQSLLPHLDRAACKVYEDYPEGQYFVVVRQQSSVQKLFLGKVVSAKAVVRVYKFK